MGRTAAIVVAACAVALTGGSATAASAEQDAQIGISALAAPGAAGQRDPVFLIPVTYPLHMKARTATVSVTLLAPRRKHPVLERSRVKVRLSAGLEQPGADRREFFTFVHAVPLRLRGEAARLQRAGRLDARIFVSATLDADGDGRAEADTADSRSPGVVGGNPADPFCATPPVVYVRAGASVRQQLPRCSVPVRWSIARQPAHGSASRTAATVSYRARRGARGWDGLLLRARPIVPRRGGRAAAAAAAAQTIPVVVQVGSGAPSSVRVRAIGDSITAGFGWYDDGSAMSLEQLLGCKPNAVENDACSSNSLTTSNTAPLQFAPDYGLSNKIAWPAQWASANGVTDFANYAVTGSTPSDWLPGGRFNAFLDAAAASKPDYLVFTLGANPLLHDLLFGLDTMKCAIWSDLFGDYTRCVEAAFARVNLAGNLRALYALLLASTPPSTTIIAMQYYDAVPSTALAYTSAQLERTADLLDQAIQQAVAAAGSARLQTLAPPRFNTGIDMSPLYPSRFSCLSGGFVDGPSAQSTLTQDEYDVDPLVKAFCPGTPWIISGDTGIHPSVAGHAQIASVLPAP